MNDIINTPNFIKWFGDWKTGNNCSKVIDKNGMPLIVYHGTNSDFDEFKSEFMGQTGTALGQGFYFTSRKDEAEYFGNNVKAFYLNIRKPLNSEKITIKASGLSKLIDSIDKTQSSFDEDSPYGLLSNYGDVDSNRNGVLREAVNSILGYSENDIDIVGELINVSGDYDLTVNSLRNVLGYDGIINTERDVYVVHHPKQIKQINSINFNANSNKFNESRKKIYISESQFELLKNRLK